MLIVGLDWSRRNHAYLFMDEQGQILERGTVAHTGDGFEELAGCIDRWSDRPQQVRIGVEAHDGALTDWLLGRGYTVFAIQPKSAQRARDMFRPSGSKDDRLDALVIAEFVRLNSGRLRPLQAESSRTRQLRDLLRWRTDLVQQRTAEINRLRALLDQWAPGLSGLCDDLKRRWQQELLQRFPTESDLAAAHGNTIRAFGRRCRLRRPSLDRIKRVRRAVAMPLSEHRRQMLRRQVCFLVEQIQRLNDQIESIEEELNDLIEQHPDAPIFRSLPVGGTVTLATLLAIFGEDRNRAMSWEAIAARCGVAPITIASGKSRSVRRRRACDHTYQHVLTHFAFNSAFAEGCWAADYYQRKRAEGTRHHAALRCLAKRWIKIIYRLWKDRMAYDEQLHRNRQAMRQQRAA